MPSVPIRDVAIAFVGAAAAAAAFYAATPTAGQAPAARIPRTADGKPDLNGIWQALNTANYDLEAHAARPAMAMRPGPVVPVPAKEVVALGAVGSVPAGLGVVVGGAFRTSRKPSTKKKENQENWLTRDPEIKCYLPGRAARDLHAVSVSDLSEREGVLHRVRVRGRGAQHLPEGSRPAAGRRVDGAVGRDAGRATRSSSTTNGFNDQSWFDRAGNHHSEALKVTERYTMTGPDHIQYEATIEDPKVVHAPVDDRDAAVSAREHGRATRASSSASSSSKS